MLNKANAPDGGAPFFEQSQSGLKLGVMGDKDSIYGFASVGLNILPADNGAEGTKLLEGSSRGCSLQGAGLNI